MNQHKVWKHFNQLYHIQYINTKICVVTCRLGYKWFTIYKGATYDDIRFKIIHLWGLLWTVLSFVVRIKHIYIYIYIHIHKYIYINFWEVVRETSSAKKTEQNYWNSLAFAILFVRVAVLHSTFFWAPDISFNVHLGFKNPGTKKMHYLQKIDNRVWIAWTNHTKPALAQIKKKLNIWKTVDKTKKITSIHYRIFFKSCL